MRCGAGLGQQEIHEEPHHLRRVLQPVTRAGPAVADADCPGGGRKLGEEVFVGAIIAGREYEVRSRDSVFQSTYDLSLVGPDRPDLYRLVTVYRAQLGVGKHLIE